MVLDGAGKPIPGARVWLGTRSPDDGSSTAGRNEIYTDRSGRYRFLVVSPGMRYLQAFVGTAAETSIGDYRAVFEVEPGQHVERILRFRR